MEGTLPPTPLGTIGRYELVDRLATGGMADVFLAVDPHVSDDHPVVLKRILPHLAQDETFVRMFLQEARIAMSVRHDNVVEIDKLGEHNGLPYLAMEYIAGLTFRELERRAAERGRRVPTGVAIDLIRQAAQGAQAVHDTIVGDHTEIVHRDLCPHNLMVDEEGVVKVLDFGIAKAAQGMDTTRTGALKGKIAYLAPEQIRRDRVDRRTDVYTLCVVAWELLARRRMFDPDLSDYDLMQAIVTGQIPRLEDVNPDLPGLIVEVVHRGLALEPRDRFASAEELRTNLDLAASMAEVPCHPIATRSFVRAVLDLHDGEEPVAEDPSDVMLTRGEIVHQMAIATPVPSTPSEPPAPPPRSFPWAVLIASFIVVAGVLFIGGVGIGAYLLAPPALTGPPVTITWAPVMPPADMIEELEPLRADLEATLGQPVNFQVAQTYRGAGARLAKGETDFAVLPPYLYLQVQAQMGEDLVLVASTEHDNSRGVDGIIIGGEGLTWEGADSVKGRSFCFTDTSSTTGYMLPRQWMRDHDIDPDRDLGRVVMSGNHHQVIADVAQGKCEAGATFSAALRSAFEVDVPAAQTRQLEITGRTPNDAFCAGPATDPELAATFRAALLAWDPQALHGERFIGPRQHLTGFNAGNDADYDGLRRALAAEGAPGG